jgi:hypothetical protein
MFRLARLAVLSATCLALTSLPLLSQSQPASPDQSSPQSSVPATQAAPPQAPLPAGQAAPLQTVTPAEQLTQPKAAAPADPKMDSAARSAADKSDKNHKTDDDKPIAADEIHNAVLWHDPGNVASKDLFYGQGGQDGRPRPPFKFLDEDMNGTNPKFNVSAADGKKWRVKLGEEARPEVVASRLLWAVGYYANDDYDLHVATIEGLDIKRGTKRVHNGTQVVDARFERKPGGESKQAIWQWKSNPFLGTREFNGLRVMMAVVNNWDLKDVNNSVYKDEKTGQQIFLINDIGATFATNALATSRAKDKGNLKSYENSKFITHETASEVDFGTPAAPTGVLIKSGGILAKDYFTRQGFDWIGHDIPREDARWVGSLLGQLTHQQLEDAFRAGHFTPAETEQYVNIVEQRIAQLKAL